MNFLDYFNVIYGNNGGGKMEKEKSKSKSRKKKVIVITALLLVIVIGVIGVNSLKGKEEGVEVDVMTLEKGQITVTVPANGLLEEVEKQTIYVEDSAKVLSIEVEEGDYVVAGQVLALLDGEDLDIQMDIKKEMLEINKLELEKLEKAYEEEKAEEKRQLESRLRKMEEAKADLEKHEELYEHGAISQQEYENYKRTYEDAKESYKALKDRQDTHELDVEKMKKNIAITQLEIEEIAKRIEKQESKIVSSINGVVTNIHLEEGSFVNPSNPGFVISNVDDLAIEINVNEYDIAKVEIGQEVEIETDALPGKTFKGVVEKIAPVAKIMSTGQTNETVIPVTIKVEEKDELLKPGFSVKTKIICQEKEDVLVLPFDVIMVESNGAKNVFVVRDDILHKMEVQTGVESDFDVEIVAGLEEGDKIVMNPSSMLEDGMKVIVNERQQDDK